MYRFCKEPRNVAICFPLGIFLDEVDTLDVDADDDVDAELDVDALENKFIVFYRLTL